MNEAKQKFCLTSLERAWILYDVGNSAFVLLVATLIPIFFNALAEEGGLSSVEYLAYWGYAASAVTSHQTAVIKRARFSAVIWEMPMLPAPSTSARQTTKGTQLPM